MAFEDKMINPTLDSVRQAARSASYPNSEVETKAVTALEQEIGARVRVHEEGLRATAEAVYASGDRPLAQADELLGEMSDLLSDIERAGARPGYVLAARYETARKNMALRIAALEKVERDAEFHAAKVLDPYGSLQNLRQKYPQIVLGRSV